MTPALRLTRLIRRLRSYYGTPVAPPVRDPYRLLLWEQVAYLASDAERRAAFRLLEQQIGTEPGRILSAAPAKLRAVTRRGGAIGVSQRAERLRMVARRVVEHWNGKLGAVKRLPLAAARRELARYPSIGEAGAERILLLSGAYPLLALDSNALRVLLRLGYGREYPRWTETYRAAQAAAEPEVRPTVAARKASYLLLREHGQTLCRRTTPRCPECPLQPDCPTGGGRVS